jgi:hypothetical protein
MPVELKRISSVITSTSQTSGTANVVRIAGIGTADSLQYLRISSSRSFDSICIFPLAVCFIE